MVEFSQVAMIGHLTSKLANLSAEYELLLKLEIVWCTAVEQIDVVVL